MFLAGCVLIFFVGCFLGALGAGGAIFSIPILVYAFNLPQENAIGVSYVVTGITALIAAIKYFKDINWYKYTYFFIIPAVLMTYLTRHSLLPYLESMVSQELIHQSLMITLSITMFISAFFMTIYVPKPHLKKNHYYFTVFLAMVYGSLVGSIGSGGGFLLIPTFRLLMHMSLKQAVATSLSVIAITTLFGFEADEQFLFSIPWKLVIVLTVISILGMLLGEKLHHKYTQNQLQNVFIITLVLTALAIFFNQITNFVY